MDFLYVLLYPNDDWDGMSILLSKEQAIAKSVKHPSARVEIFVKNDKSEYKPSYNYYQNGKFFGNSSVFENQVPILNIGC